MEILDLDKVYVGEYSHSQDAFHIHKLSIALQRNKHSVVVGPPTDYIPFCIGGFEFVTECIDEAKDLSGYEQSKGGFEDETA